ncbi:uncharacterized protein LOC114314230 [Camellia sinensis]|uniref:uncharacterized protein LOC114314230 n=1 Tax=Camellia sinensis TaxID=4442 RepID=UPI0010360CD1|nr:uncharacterized protein LOC114314230 [Camellia sinensis]
MSWNVRGLGKLEKKGRIRKLIYERKADVVLFQETKKVSISECEVRASRGRRNMDFMVVGSNGTAGGLLCIWDPDFFRLVDCYSNRRFILLSESAFPNPWCLGGDVNEIRNIGERVGCFRRDKGMMDLNSFIESCELNDLPLLGRKFTWCNAQDGERWSKIDRILLNPEWLLKFNFKLWGLPRLFSYHCRLLLIDDERDWGPKPFRFINAWTIHPSFPSLLEKVWQEARINGRAGYVLFQKLKLLKVELKKWNSKVFGNLSTKLKKTEEELVALDILAEGRPLVEAEKIERRTVRGEVWKLSRIVE